LRRRPRREWNSARRANRHSAKIRRSAKMPSRAARHRRRCKVAAMHNRRAVITRAATTRAAMSQPSTTGSMSRSVRSAAVNEVRTASGMMESEALIANKKVAKKAVAMVAVPMAVVPKVADKTAVAKVAAMVRKVGVRKVVARKVHVRRMGVRKVVVLKVAAATEPGEKADAVMVVNRVAANVRLGATNRAAAIVRSVISIRAMWIRVTSTRATSILAARSAKRRHRSMPNSMTSIPATSTHAISIPVRLAAMSRAVDCRAAIATMAIVRAADVDAEVADAVVATSRATTPARRRHRASSTMCHQSAIRSKRNTSTAKFPTTSAAI